MTGEITYCDDSAPGITRRKMRNGWGYYDADGERITDRTEIDRLNAIGLPPAYRDAWFCPSPDGHIQAVGWDDKGRKQYRYHTGFREAQEAAKYDRCAGFGLGLVKLRKRVERDLRSRKMGRDRAIAAVVRLLDCGRVRVGNDVYARTNKSFGATTLLRRHVALKGSRLKLQYRAKSGKMRVMTITDNSLIRFVKRCHDLPGQRLFSWLDDDGEARPVTSSDVNAYIREAMGEGFTAKHFRTWGASVLAFEALADAKSPIGLSAMIEPVVEALGNTPTIARKSYVHPALIALAKDKAAQTSWQQGLRLPRKTRYLTRAERGFIAFLEAEAASPNQPARAA